MAGVRAHEPVGSDIAGSDREEIYRPDAKDAAAVEVTKVVGLALSFQQNRCDEKTGEDKEERDSAPSPQCALVKRSTDKPRFAVVEKHTQNSKAAQTIELRDARRKPLRPLHRLLLSRYCFRLHSLHGSRVIPPPVAWPAPWHASQL